MCGIYALVPVIHTASKRDDEDWTPGRWLARRGPDGMETKHTEAGNVQLSASVLGMRNGFASQPVTILADGVVYYFAWNGEIYDADLWNTSVMDTEYMANELQKVLSSAEQETPQSIAMKLKNILSSLSNVEFACCLVTPHAVIYARDSWGRRSLVVAKDIWCVASVASSTDPEAKWEEVEPGIVHIYNVSNQESSSIPFDTPPIIAPYEPSLFSSMTEASLELETVLLDAVRRRCIEGNTAVLFSGGLDSVVVAALALRILPCITLVTVSFVDNGGGDDDGMHTTANAADAVAAEASYRELQSLFPDKEINFTHRVVDWSLVEEKEDHIKQLILPKATTMDINIASALWFAAGAAEGQRALLSGLGADEFMGGYGRHRRSWTVGGWHALAAELELDQSRLWNRNMGRDDRVLSDTSHEVRFPFLDSGVVHLLRHLPLEHVVDYAMESGGDKRILRLVAERMGLQAASKAPKRAIQFGSRVAHVSDKRRFGSRRKSSGTAIAVRGTPTPNSVEDR